MEQWKDIPGFELKYMVSDHGRVLSMCRAKWKFLKPWPSGKGHLKVLLANSQNRYVHELVLTSFVGPRPEGMISRHLNGVHTDNRLVNLEWNTTSVNRYDVKHHGGNHRQLSVGAILNIKQSLMAGITRQVLAKTHGVSVSTIQAIANGAIHSEVSDQLTYRGSEFGVIDPANATNVTTL